MILDIVAAGVVLFLLAVWFSPSFRRAVLRFLPKGTSPASGVVNVGPSILTSPVELARADIKDGKLVTLQVLAEAGAHCSNCRSFDLEEGQNVLANADAFPSQILSPAQMGHTANGHVLAPAEGAPINDLETDEIDETIEGRMHTWKQYGACAKHMQLCNEHDRCKDWS